VTRNASDPDDPSVALDDIAATLVRVAVEAWVIS